MLGSEDFEKSPLNPCLEKYPVKQERLFATHGHGESGCLKMTQQSACGSSQSGEALRWGLRRAGPGSGEAEEEGPRDGREARMEQEGIVPTAQPFRLMSREAPVSRKQWGRGQIRVDRGARTRGSEGDQSPATGVGQAWQR